MGRPGIYEHGQLYRVVGVVMGGRAVVKHLIAQVVQQISCRKDENWVFDSGIHRMEVRNSINEMDIGIIKVHQGWFLLCGFG